MQQDRGDRYRTCEAARARRARLVLNGARPTIELAQGRPPGRGARRASPPGNKTVNKTLSFVGPDTRARANFAARASSESDIDTNVLYNNVLTIRIITYLQSASLPGGEGGASDQEKQGSVTPEAEKRVVFMKSN